MTKISVNKFSTLFTLGFLLHSGWANAGNISVFGVAARAESMEAFTAVADDPSAIYYNPAGITQVKKTEIDTGAALIMPDVTYTNALNNASSTTRHPALSPNLFATSNHWQPFYFGVGVYAPFARLTDFDPNAAVYNTASYGRILRLDVVPTIAYEINPYISLGAGLVGSRVDITSNILGLSESGDGYGVTGQGGILVQLPKQVKLGFVYRGPMRTTVNGVGKFIGMQDDFSSDIDFPATMSAGVSVQPLTSLILSAAYDYEKWSTLHELKRNYSNPVFNQLGTTPLNGTDSSNIRLGAMYRHEANEFRVGYMYTGAAIPQQNVVPALPDYNGNVYSLGISHYWNQVRLDAGYEYTHVNTLQSTNFFFPGQHQGHINTILLGIGYSLT